MNFEIKRTKEKYETTYKTIYIRQNLIDQIEKIASEHQTSFNNVVISMIEACLSDGDAILEEMP